MKSSVQSKTSFSIQTVWAGSFLQAGRKRASVLQPQHLDHACPAASCSRGVTGHVGAHTGARQSSVTNEVQFLQRDKEF